MATVVQYNKYERLRKQVSYDNGVTWADVEPAEYQKGNLLEINSRDCGYNLVYQWDNQVMNGSIVSVEKISYNDGSVWRPTGSVKVNGSLTDLEEAVAEFDGLEQYMGDMDAAADDYVDSVENNSGSEEGGSDSGSDGSSDVDPDPGESEDNSYLSVYLYQKWVKHSGQSAFVPKWPLEYSIEGEGGAVTTRKDHDPECGYTPPYDPIYRWRVDGYICVEEAVEVTTQYRWTDSGKYICLSGNKWSLLKRQKSEDGGITWTDVEPAEYRRGQMIEQDSTDCANRVSVDYYLDSAGDHQLALDRGGRVEAVWVDGDNIDFSGQNITFNAPAANRYHVDFAINGNQVPSYMFASRTELDTVSIPSKFTNIGYYAFQDCTHLRDLYMEGVQTINIGAFEGCYNLVQIEFPDTLVSIDDEAFAACQSLEELTFKGDVPPIISERTFYNCPLARINVTQAAYDYFINDQIWSQYASIIQVMN